MIFSGTHRCFIVATLFRIVITLFPILRRCIVLKIVVANRLVQHNLSTDICRSNNRAVLVSGKLLTLPFTKPTFYPR